MSNNDKIILDLCGGTGSWAKPYKDAGYTVVTITLPDYDVNKAFLRQGDFFFPSSNKSIDGIQIRKDAIYGILAAPPCTMFSMARTNAKTPRDLEEGMKCVRSCLDIIWKCMEEKMPTARRKVRLKFWALENPERGMLKYFLGEPSFVFEPWMFGDDYKKSTAIWGNFKKPEYTHPKLNKKLKKFDKLKTKEIHGEFYGKFDRTTRRSITPQGFAQAFFEINK